MGNMAQERTNSIPALSDRFWQLANGLMGAWDMMNALLEKEWQMLKTRRMSGLWRIVRDKERLASKLHALERLLDAEIPGYTPGRSSDADARWKALCSAASSHAEKTRLIKWRTGLKERKRLAFETNRRLWAWIAQQQELTRRLAGILTGNDAEDSVTYRLPAASQDSPVSTSPSRLSAETDSLPRQEGLITGISPNRINSALKAYGAANTAAERLGSWD